MKRSPEQIIKNKDRLKQQRGVSEVHWQELAEYNVPNKNNFTRTVIAGEKKGVELFDSTSMVSCDTLASALHGLLTNPNTLWFILATTNPFLLQEEHILEYLQDLTRRAHGYLNNSNFQTELHEYYIDLCAFGTATMTVEEDDEYLFRFSTKFLGELYVEENAFGMIEDVYREFDWMAPQIIQMFGKGVDLENRQEVENAFGPKIANAYFNGTNAKFTITHNVYREHLTETLAMPFMSQYILDCEKRELQEGKFRRFPYIISRWEKVSGEVYGRSPAMNALPEAKTLNTLSKAVIKGAQKTVDPPVQMPDDGFVRPLKTYPSGVNYYRAGSTDRVEPIFNDARIDISVEVMRERQLKIQRAFFIDRLNLAQNDRMTQLEVSQRVQEQLRFMGPVVGRQQTEFLRPLIDRILDIMVKRDGGTGEILGDVPEELLTESLDVTYTSPIARAQRISEAEALGAALAASAPAFEMDPSSMDIINGDMLVKENFAIYGASQKVLRKKNEVNEIRDARMKAQEQAIQQQQAQQDAEVVNKVSPLLKA